MTDKRKKWRWLIKIILALERITAPLTVHASPVWSWNPITTGWMGVYLKLIPWIKRISVLFIVIGTVKMMEGYAKDGVNGIAKGVIYIATGGMLYAVCL